MSGYNDPMNRPIDPRRIEAVDPAVAAILRAKAPHERIEMAAAAHRMARQFLRAQVMRMNLGWTTEQVQREVARRLANGTDRSAPARPGRS